MGLFRLGAIVAVGVALLPAERDKQDQLYERAAVAAKWTMTFCDRNAATCDHANTAWQTFVAKAEFGARLALDVVRDNQPSSVAQTGSVAPASLERSSTLRPADLKPAWRGKTASKHGA